jgi:hypothetical protein
MTDYFDRAGKPISRLDWFLKTLCGPYYCEIHTTDLSPSHRISTIWRGTRPGLFETMVFPSHRVQRYETEAEALAGHAQMVEEESR